MAEPEWTIHRLIFRRSVTLVDGTKWTKYLVMRRKVDGKWQYREPTQGEIAEDMRAEAW